MRVPDALLFLPLLSLGCAAASLEYEATGQWNGTVQVHGALHAMFQDGQTGAVVNLESVLPNPKLYGVGALADLAGEVTVVEGMAYLSYPSGPDTTRTEVVSQTTTGAALLVAAEVEAWRDVRIERTIRFEDLDREIPRLAALAGLQTLERFPFLLEGEFEDLQWHVIDGRRLAGRGTSRRDHLEASVRATVDRASATIIGFFSETDQGVFTHMGSKTHLHCVLGDPVTSGHVDNVIIPAGTTVRFPTGVNPRPELRDRLRDRLEHEGRLLNNRTSMFLVANGLGAVAVGLEGVPGAAVMGVLVVANGLWLLCGLQTRSAIRSLTLLHFAEKKTGHISDPADDAVREGLRWVPKTVIRLISWGIGCPCS